MSKYFCFKRKSLDISKDLVMLTTLSQFTPLLNEKIISTLQLPSLAPTFVAVLFFHTTSPP